MKKKTKAKARRELRGREEANKPPKTAPKSEKRKGKKRETEKAPRGLALYAPKFKEGVIPTRYTYDLCDVSPPLKWKRVPTGTRSLVLIVDDPDAKKVSGKRWTHWVLYNIPIDWKELPDGLDVDRHRDPTDPFCMRCGLNDWKRAKYLGPKPPVGSTHRYVFRLFAVDTKFRFDAPPTKKQMLEAMKGHVLAKAKLTAEYTRKA